MNEMDDCRGLVDSAPSNTEHAIALARSNRRPNSILNKLKSLYPVSDSDEEDDEEDEDSTPWKRLSSDEERRKVAEKSDFDYKDGDAPPQKRRKSDETRKNDETRKSIMIEMSDDEHESSENNVVNIITDDEDDESTDDVENGEGLQLMERATMEQLFGESKKLPSPKWASTWLKTNEKRSENDGRWMEMEVDWSRRSPLATNICNWVSENRDGESGITQLLKFWRRSYWICLGTR
jgi:hypothetical protein